MDWCYWAAEGRGDKRRSPAYCLGSSLKVFKETLSTLVLIRIQNTVCHTTNRLLFLFIVFCNDIWGGNTQIYTISSQGDTLYTIHYTLYTIHYTLYTIHYTLYTIHYTLYTIHYTLYQYHSVYSVIDWCYWAAFGRAGRSPAHCLGSSLNTFRKVLHKFCETGNE